MKKSFETKMFVDGKELSLNNFCRKPSASSMAGFSKTLKGLDEAPEMIEVKIRRLPTPSEVDAYVYP
jgi:hypothetical protein